MSAGLASLLLGASTLAPLSVLSTPETTTTPEFTTTPFEDPLPEGVCDPSLLYGLSPFEGDGSVEVIDFNQFEIYYNQTTLIGFDGEIQGFTYFGYDDISCITCTKSHQQNKVIMI